MGLFSKKTRLKAVKRVRVPKARPKMRPKPLINPENREIVKKTKTALHDIYFSKKMEEKEKNNAIAIKGMTKDMAVTSKENDKKIAELEVRIAKRMDDVEKSMLAIRGIIDDLRKENEELRKDRQFFVEKLKESINSQKPGGEIFENIGPEGEEVPPGRATPATFQEGSKKIQTSMDALLDLVAAKGSIKLSAAAKKLKVKEKDVEEWARVLEEHDLLEVRYPTFGSPMLKKKK
jgi:hypothetical protein